MKTRRIAAVSAFGALAILAGSCGTKDATGPTIRLTVEEVFALAGELGAVMNSYAAASVRSAMSGAHAGGPARSVAPSTAFRATASCTAGGSTTVAGSYVESTSSASANATFSYDNCKTVHYITDGSLSATGGLIIGQTGVMGQATAGGTLTVSTADGRSGSCAIDVTVNITGDFGGNTTYVVSGTACGVKVSGTY